uniref:Uncharacterized protein n=1 Tax=Tetraselmis sp. GSL018 TaxID=582737 RepID=A0A061RSD7_9CHLO
MAVVECQRIRHRSHSSMENGSLSLPVSQTSKKAQAPACSEH